MMINKLTSNETLNPNRKDSNSYIDHVMWNERDTARKSTKKVSDLEAKAIQELPIHLMNVLPYTIP